MNTPRWLRPVLGMVLAIAVGIAGCLVASAFAEPETPPVISVEPLETVPAQVIEPAATGDEEVILTEDDLGDASGWSESTGEQPVVAEPFDGPTPVEQAIMAAMETAADPAEVLGGSEELPSADGIGVYAIDDPCGTEDAADDCPSGTRSVILPLYGSGELRVEARAYPPRYEDSPTSKVTCPAVSEADDSVPFGVATTEPVAIRISYGPTSGGLAQIVTLEPDAEAVAAWEQASAGAGNATVWLSTCTELGGIVAGEEYNVTVEVQRAEVTADSDIASTYVGFILDEPDLRPPTIVQAIGDGMLYVASYHEHDVTAEISARLDPDGTGECSGSADQELERVQETNTVESDLGWLTANGYSTTFIRRSQSTFYVPEGERIVVCVTQEREDAPSWTRDNPFRAERWIVLSPDRMVPTVTIESAVIGAGVSAVTVSASTTEGQLCGEAATPLEPTATLDVAELAGAVLCDGTSRVARSADTDGDIAINSLVTAEGVDYDASMVLRLSDDACSGACEVPASSTYVVPLGTVTVHRGICSPGLFESTCTPPATTVAAGVVEVRVDWATGSVNGRTDWAIEAQPLLEGSAPESDTPRMDTRQQVGITEYERGSILDHVDASFLLVPDRPVDYRVTLSGSDCRIGADGVGSPTTEEVTGSLTGPQRISFGNLCYGERYSFTVELTDETGATATYTQFGDGETEAWWLGYVRTPFYDADLTLGFQLESLPGADSTARLIQSVAVFSSGRRIGELSSLAGVCLTDQVVSAELRDVFPLTTDASIRFQVQWAPADDDACAVVRTEDVVVTEFGWGYGGRVFFSDPPRELDTEADIDPFRVAVHLTGHLLPAS